MVIYISAIIINNPLKYLTFSPEVDAENIGQFVNENISHLQSHHHQLQVM